jgi:RNA polymerase sigma-70 factor, ECF subfamily
MDENQLIQDARSGDLNSFNRLVLAYQDLAFNLAARMLSDSDLAEDMTQAAFLSAYRNLNSFRGGSFKAWVMRMVTNACYDELRRRQRHPTTSLEPVDDDEEEIESPAWIADGSPSPEESAERRELERAIQHCLSGLENEFRAVVIMVDLQGMDYSEVSAALNRPLGTIKSRLARARLKLRDCLNQFGELLPSIFRLDDQRSV